MENREEAPLCEALANELLTECPELAYIANSQVRIRYLKSDLAKKSGRGRIVNGECEKIPAKYKWAIPADFTITVYIPNMEYMDNAQLKILLFHELLHVGIDKDPGGKETYSIVKHDLEDFKTIIDKYGANWAEKKK